MASMFDYETPTGSKGNILKPHTWIPLILGGIVLLGTFSAAEKIGRGVGSKIPLLDVTPASPWKQPPAATPQNNKMYIG